jgi:hypothetical protein
MKEEKRAGHERRSLLWTLEKEKTPRGAKEFTTHCLSLTMGHRSPSLAKASIHITGQTKGPSIIAN